MSDENSGNEEFDDFIDKAIDEMFVPRAKSPSEDSPGAIAAGSDSADEALSSDDGAVEAEQEEAVEEEIDLTISWDQNVTDAQADEAPQTSDDSDEGYSGPLLFEPPPKADTPSEPISGPDDSQEEDLEGGPKLDELKPVHEAMLSLDWEISAENIAAVEEAFEALRALHGDNYHMESAIKLALITCKYLRASKTYATPLAIKYLNEAVASGDVFLSERGPGKPSPEALTNDLLGLYNKMKVDANRLRAIALKERDDTGPPKPAEVAPLAATAAPSPAMGDNPVKGALLDLWDSMEQIRGRLHGASAQGAPFAEAIDASCERFQEDLKVTISLTDSQPSTKDVVKLDALDKTASDLGAALERFKAQLAQLRTS